MTGARRILLGAAAALLAGLALAPASFEASDPSGIVFSLLPARTVAGEGVTVAISHARPGAVCSLAVRYARNGNQTGLTTAVAIGGRASWSWKVPDSIQADFATLNAACAGSKRISGKLLVVGSLTPPKLAVQKDGFSIRPNPGGSTSVSYGVLIHNQSPNEDALNVSVLVNFVLADGHLLGSTPTTVPLIAAGSTYALGNAMTFPAAAPIARLEIVMQVGTAKAHTGHPPALDNVVIEPSLLEPAWVGDVAGEVIDNDPTLTLQATQFSAVILDAAGNVLGGGTGSTFGSLPPGTRMVFQLSGGGFSDIPTSQAASVLVSAIPTWQPSA
jgi:hypothetical protein